VGKCSKQFKLEDFNSHL